MRFEYRGYLIADWRDKTGAHWTRVANPLQPRTSLWAVPRYDVDGARAHVDGLYQQQSKAKSYHPSEDLDGPPPEILEAAYFLGFKTIPNSATAINTAYKMLALRFHPDKPEGSNEAMMLLNTARDMLIAYLE